MKKIILLVLLYLPISAMGFDCSSFPELKNNPGYCSQLKNEIPNLLFSIEILSDIIRETIDESEHHTYRYNEKCETAKCYRKQLFAHSKALWIAYVNIPENNFTCSEDPRVLALESLRQHLAQNRRDPKQYSVSMLEVIDANAGDRRVDLNDDSVTDKIFTVQLSYSSGQSAIGFYGLVTRYRGCLINVGDLGTYLSPYTGSSGTEALSSFPVSSLDRWVDANGLSYKQLMSIISNDSFDTEAMQVLVKQTYSGCAGACNVETFYLFDKKSLLMVPIYERENDTHGVVSEKFFYPRGFKGNS